MQFKSIMHVAFFTDRMEEMIDFYQNKLGASIKCLVRYDVYRDRADRPRQQKIALEDPQRIFNVYLEIAPGQFLELFPKMEGQAEDTEWNRRLGYSHYALLVDDIFAVREELAARGVAIDTEPSKGPSGTWQLWVHDPDGNKFEIMQYTEDSYQVKGYIG